MNPSLRQVVRMLAMVPYLQSNQGIPLVELAGEFKIRPAQAQRELEMLMLTGWGEFHGEMIDFDLTALEDEGVVRIRDAEFMPRPLRVSRREAAALMVALRALRQDAVDDQAPIIDSALAKLAEAADAELPDAVDVVLPQVDPRVHGAVAQALAARRQLQITYVNETRDERTERVIEPHRAFTQDGHRYLSAWCHLAEAERSFRVDRIAEATVLDAPVATESRGGSGVMFAASADAPSIVVEVAPQGRWLVDHYRMDVLSDAEDGTVLARLHGGHEGWLRRVVLRAGGTLRVVEPSDMATEVRNAARSALAAYDGLIDEQGV